MYIQSPTLPLWRSLRAQGQINPDYLLSLFSVHFPPVDVHGIARQLGVIVHHVSNPGWSGAVSSTDTRAEVWLAVGDRPVRERFTLAHELGHLFLHPLGVAYRDAHYEPGTSTIEAQANNFAASLLMPDWMVRVAMQSTGGDVQRLARLFDVSESAMKYRLVNLGLR
ncbi:ImmA/IrrE family metallo-endopeptidase [Archangium violaceum]|uniref:ImmA/IrrE family metallo-endopeptidase n=1 Tax=Archangium violaceum TaxID=83451 RepID=UPI0037C09F08